MTERDYCLETVLAKAKRDLEEAFSKRFHELFLRELAKLEARDE